jgi:hypothetical protein
LFEEAVVTEPTRADSLEPLRGRWKITGVTLSGDDRPPEGARLNEAGTVLAIDGDRLTRDGEAVATLGGDSPSCRRAREELGDGRGEPVLLTLPGGREVLCSFRFFEGGRVLRLLYPHDACTRSGQAVYLERLPD